MTAADTIPEETAARLNMLMRPADGINNYAINAGILGAITDAGGEAERIAALAYVFATKPFARWSGPPTPASEYPPALDAEGRDREAFEALMEDLRFAKQLQALGMQVTADEVDVPERARRAWMFLNEHAATPMTKITALSVMLVDDSPFLGRATPPTELRYTETIPNEECNQIRWRHRAVIARLNGISSSDAIRQKATLGSSVLAALSEVSDERERAFILGSFFNDVRSDIITKTTAFGLGNPIATGALIGALHAAADQRRAPEKDGICPFCNEVHETRKEHAGDE
ncbi:hypothetical protein HY480_03210 [Candidatus Uhrbacteria bacterium]|nr:hypothetical protein [Candidatus Uhrbacteria bacterium]